MKKRILSFLLILLCVSGCFAAVYHSVPVDHEVYRIIDAASIRGIIPVQTSVKPYSTSKVLSLLDQMEASGMLSDAEIRQVEQIYKELERKYGNADVQSKKDVLKNLFYRTASSNNSSFSLGLKMKTVQTGAYEFTEPAKMWDSRNSATVFVMGDLFNAVTYDLNISMALDRLAPGAFLLTDFNFDADGWYQDDDMKKHELTQKDSGKFFMGFSYVPEISTSMFDDMLSMRFGSIKHDWGVGIGNFIISPSAGTMDAFEFTASPVSWAHFSVIDASLEKFSLGESYKNPGKIIGADGTPVRYPSDDLKEDYFNNNLATHRFELGPIYGVKLGVWESVVYRKRLEIGYLNPFALYMFTQNACSDFDNEIAGVDLSVNLAKNFQIYGGFGMDEVRSLKKILKNPRNLLEYQLGMKWAIPELPFSRLVVQFTYVPAFFGSHYAYGEHSTETTNNPAGFLGWTTAYVNKGHLIGYPVNPDTIECLISFDGTIKNNWNLNITFKDQIRSVQYSTKTTGTDILDTMYYDEEKQYADRDFFNNIGINDADLKITVSKKLDESPVTLMASIEGLLHSYRAFKPNATKRTRANSGDSNLNNSPVYDYYNLGSGNTYYSWSNEYTAIASFGVKVNY